MSESSYVVYLETVLLSLMAEREDEFEIQAISDDPSYDGYSFSSINIKEEINRHRDLR